MSYIETFDRKRQQYIGISSFFFLIWMAILLFFLNSPQSMTHLKGILLIIQLVAMVVWGIYRFRLYKMSKQLKADKQLLEAIDNELYQLYRLKSFRVAFIATIITITVLLMLMLAVSLTAQLACHIIMYVSVSAGVVASYWYHKA